MRLLIVEQAIGTIPDLGLVIIDGIRDFLYDINSPGESTDIISKFMQWTDDRQIHIHTVLHQNKNDKHARLLDVNVKELASLKDNVHCMITNLVNVILI